MTTSSILATLAASRTSSMLASGLPKAMLSRTLALSSCASWSTKETVEKRVSCDISRRSTPPMEIDPESGSSKRAMSVARVLLPEPDGPSNAVTVPGSRVRETPLSALVCPYEYSTSSTRTRIPSGLRGFSALGSTGTSSISHSRTAAPPALW